MKLTIPCIFYKLIHLVKCSGVRYSSNCVTENTTYSIKCSSGNFNPQCKNFIWILPHVHKIFYVYSLRCRIVILLLFKSVTIIIQEFPDQNWSDTDNNHSSKRFIKGLMIVFITAFHYGITTVRVLLYK